VIIILRVASQEHSVHNKLPNCVSETTQLYDRCLRLSTWSQNVRWYIIKKRWDVIIKNKTRCIVVCNYLLYTLLTPPCDTSTGSTGCILTVYNNTPSFVNNYISSIFNNMSADILWPYGQSETSVITFSGSTNTIWQFVVLWVLLWSYPEDDDHKSDRNILVFGNNIW
jgi:hypothetical protein